MADQSLSTQFGTAALTLTPTHPFTQIPGLTTAIDSVANTRVFVTTDGGVQTTTTTPGVVIVVDVVLAVDGALLHAGGYKRLTAASGTFEYWSMSTSIDLPPGPHTIGVFAKGVDAIGVTNAIVSGDGTSVLRGELTTMILKTE